MSGLAARIEALTGTSVTGLSPLSGGCVGDVQRVELADGRTLVAKSPESKNGGADSGLALEGAMLEALADAGAPVPDVIFADETLLIMTYIRAGGRMSAAAEAHAASILAALHDRTAPAYGYETDTVIGGLHQPNPWEDDWRRFFADHRLRHMAGEARSAGRLSGALFDRIDRLCGDLDRFIPNPNPPGLVHGDLWTGNVLIDGGKLVGLIDPALYYADPEVELAFSTLFGTFGDAFFRAYGERRPIQPGFFEERLGLYNLYPLLVHVRLFAGHYVQSVDRSLAKLGY